MTDLTNKELVQMYRDFREAALWELRHNKSTQEMMEKCKIISDFQLLILYAILDRVERNIKKT